MSIEIDTLILNLDLDTYRCKVFEQLDRCKAKLQATELDTEMPFLIVNHKNHLNFCIQRTGVKLYPYVLKNGDITLFLSKRSLGSIPAGRLHIGSMSSQNSIQDVLDRVEEFLRVCGIFYCGNTVSRVDLCCDVLGGDNPHEEGIFDFVNYVTRARKYDIHGENYKVTGLTFGRGDLLLRVYDKALELRHPKNSEKQKFFFKKWGKSYECVTRVEFQLRGKILGQLLGETKKYSTLLEKKAELWRYLTHEWARHHSQRIDRENRNQDKISVSSFWKKVQNFSQATRSCQRIVKSSIHKSISLLKKQLRGIMTTIAAGLGHTHDDFFGVLATASQIIQDEMAEAMKDPCHWKALFEMRRSNTILEYDDIKPWHRREMSVVQEKMKQMKLEELLEQEYIRNYGVM